MPDRCRTRHLCTRARPSAARDPRTAPTGSRDVRQTACARHQPGDGRRPSAARTRLLLLLKATHLHAGNLGRTGRGPWRPRGSPARPPMIPRCPFSRNPCVLVCGERCVTCCGRAGVERPMSSEPPYAPLIIPARAGEKFLNLAAMASTGRSKGLKPVDASQLFTTRWLCVLWARCCIGTIGKTKFLRADGRLWGVALETKLSQPRKA